MTRKIVAIGGGELGRVRHDGTRLPFELAPQFEEIISLTGKAKPKVLVLAHSQRSQDQDSYFNAVSGIFGGRYGCECFTLHSDALTDTARAAEALEKADAIYECGGNTVLMIDLWKSTGFDALLRSAWENGKVMCGVSAGACCWFDSCSTDSFKLTDGRDAPTARLECLGFIKGMFVPHAEVPSRAESAKELIREGEAGYLVSDCAALEIVGDTYRIVCSDASLHGMERGYVKKMRKKDGAYSDRKLVVSDRFAPLEELVGT